ncbi:LPD38 domain-containing protein [Ectobacillus antri]|uniref:LPD38 domain-containing protein n=1 Tax=Ectobacillus antri TaxID=2486280 RepID=UPI0013DDAFB7|nr:LPD38 domain-containing protein [Ectobacillus antri]
MAYKPKEWEETLFGKVDGRKVKDKQAYYNDALTKETQNWMAQKNVKGDVGSYKNHISRYYDDQDRINGFNSFLEKFKKKNEESQKKASESFVRDNPQLVKDYRDMGGTSQYVTQEAYDEQKRITDGFSRLQSAKKEQEKTQKKSEPSFLGDVAYTLKKWGQAANPFDDVSAKEAISDFTKNGFKGTDTKEVNRFANRTLNSATLNASDALMKGVRGEDAITWQNKREGLGNNAADFISTGLGYVVPGALGAKAIKGTKLAADTSKTGLARVGQWAKEGAAIGGGISLAETPAKAYLNPDQGVSDHAQRIALETGLGALGDVAIRGAGEGLTKVLQAINKDKAFKQLDTIMQGKDPNAPLRANLPEQAPQQGNTRSLPNKMEAITPARNEAAPSLASAAAKVPQVNTARTPIAPTSAQALPEGVQAMTSPAIPLPQASGAANGTITRQQLLDNLRNRFGVTIRTGRLSAPEDVQGIYKVTPEVIRSRNHGDLQVISHEIGHHLDKQLQLSNPKFDAELMALGQKTSGQGYTPDQVRSEGLAEFMRLYMVEPQVAQQQAPQLAQFLDSQLPKDIQAKIMDTRSDFQTWINQGAINQTIGQMNIHGSKNPIQNLKEKLQNLPKTAEELYTEGVDKLLPLSKVEKELAGTEKKVLGGLYKIKNLPDASESLYKQARLAAGTPRAAEQKLQELRKILAPIVNSKDFTLKEFRSYIAMKQARDLENHGIQSGFTKEQIEEVLQKFDNVPEMKKAQQDLLAYNNSLLDILTDAQVKTKESVEAMRKKYPNYTPFFRYFDEESSGGLTGNGFVDLNDPVKRMTGSSRDIIDPLESIIRNTFTTMKTAAHNKVGLQLKRLSQKEGAGGLIERLEGKQPVSKENIVTVFENGERVQYQLSPELYRSMKALDKESLGKWFQLAAKPTDWLRAGATLTPEFALRNPIRDQFNATVVSDVGYNPIDFFRGLKEVTKAKSGKASPVYDEWVKQGGAYGGYLSADRDVLKQNLDNLTQEGSKVQRLAKNAVKPSKWLEGLQKLSEISEESTKIGAYKKGLKKGLSPEESAYQARELMDFNRMGDKMQGVNQIYAFLNANVQGKDKLIRAFRENPVRTAARITGLTVPPTALAYASYNWANEKQKELIDNMPQWEKETYWAVAVPGTDEVARIPKPFDINAVPNAMEKGIDYFAKGDKYAFEDKKDSDVWKTVATAATPTFLKPFSENAMNHSLFTGGPIVPQRDQANSPGKQFGPTTSETAKFVGETTNSSPYKLDNLYRSYTAGLGQYPLKGLDKVITALSGKEAPTPVGKSFTESVPGVKAFFSNDLSGGKVMDDYYRIMEKQQQIAADAKDEGKEAPNKSQMTAFNKVNKDMGELRAMYRQVMADTEMSPDAKRTEVDKLNKQMKELARQGVRIFRPDYK